jgi:flagellar hook-length control protein FliK
LSSANQNGSGGALQSLFAALAERLPAGEREHLYAELTEVTSSNEISVDLRALLSEWRQMLGSAGDAAANEGLGAHENLHRLSGVSELAQRLTEDERETLRAALLDGTAANQPAGSLGGTTSAVFDVLSPEAQDALLAEAAAMLGVGPLAQAADGRSFRNLGTDPSQLRDQLREWLGNEHRAGQPLTLNSAQRGALPTEALRAFIDSGPNQPPTNDALPAGFREALASMIAGREVGTHARHEGARGESLTLASNALGGASAASSAMLGMGGAATSAAGITAPLHSPAWPQQLGQQLVMLSQRGGEQKVEIRLNPPELGPLTVSLKVMEQNTQIQFLAANAQVRAAVEQAIPQLREALAEQGIQLGETSVGEQSQHAGQEAAGAGSHGGAPGVAAGDVADEPLVEADTLGATAIHLDGRVDLYA